VYIVKPDELLDPTEPTKPISLVPEPKREAVAIVNGSVDADLTPADLAMLSELLLYLGITEVWHADAGGVDTCADAIARRMQLFVRPFRVPADVDASERMVSTAWNTGRASSTYYFAFTGTGDRELEYASRLQTHVIDLRGRPA
jgi:hypothetical protein